MSRKRTTQLPELEGERLAWFELAYHLHCTVEELEEKITPTEFLEWMSFLRMEQGRVRKLDCYLAQIAAEIRRTIVEKPNQVKISDFLMKPADKQAAPATLEERIAFSKAAWCSALGIKLPPQKPEDN